MAIRYSTLVDISISIDIYAMYQLPDGFRQDVLRRERDDPTEKDEFTTVDLGDDDDLGTVVTTGEDEEG
jgi:hypothetical protein